MTIIRTNEHFASLRARYRRALDHILGLKLPDYFAALQMDAVHMAIVTSCKWNLSTYYTLRIIVKL